MASPASPPSTTPSGSLRAGSPGSPAVPVPARARVDRTAPRVAREQEQEQEEALLTAAAALRLVSVGPSARPVCQQGRSDLTSSPV